MRDILVFMVVFMVFPSLFAKCCLCYKPRANFHVRQTRYRNIQIWLNLQDRSFERFKLQDLDRRQDTLQKCVVCVRVCVRAHVEAYIYMLY